MGQQCDQLDLLAEQIIKKLPHYIHLPVEASGRHVHLTREHVDVLFGKGHELTPKRMLSQPGQFLCEERVTLRTNKGEMSNVAVLGPIRSKTQIELSRTDATSLGIDAPVRESGDTAGSAPVSILTDKGSVALQEGAMVALRHLHISPRDAAIMRLHDGERICVKVLGSRPLIFEDVMVRVGGQYTLAMHIDFDEANACGLSKETYGLLVG